MMEKNVKIQNVMVILSIILLIGIGFNCFWYYILCSVIFGLDNLLSASSFFAFLQNWKSSLSLFATIGLPISFILCLYSIKKNNPKGVSLIIFFLTLIVFQDLMAFFTWIFFYLSHTHLYLLQMSKLSLVTSVIISLMIEALLIIGIIGLLKMKAWIPKFYPPIFLLLLLNKVYIAYTMISRGEIKNIMIIPILYIIYCIIVYFIFIYYLARPKVKRQFIGAES